jgi:cytochrome oxidase Cu insertion factor (SCO1/SenC/PrrC family)
MRDRPTINQQVRPMNDRFYWAIAGFSALLLGAFCVAAGLSFLFYPEPIVSESGTVTTGKASIGGPFALVATEGQMVTDRTYRGKWLLIYFGYTSCPDACPTALNSMSIALEKLGPRRFRMTADPRGIIRVARKAGSVRLSATESAIGVTHNVADKHRPLQTLTSVSTKTEGTFPWPYFDMMQPPAGAEIHCSTRSEVMSFGTA